MPSNSLSAPSLQTPWTTWPPRYSIGFLCLLALCWLSLMPPDANARIGYTFHSQWDCGKPPVPVECVRPVRTAKEHISCELQRKENLRIWLLQCTRHFEQARKFRCYQFPTRKSCCKANTAKCRYCAVGAQMWVSAHRAFCAQWKAKGGRCARPPRIVCCQAMTPGCLGCKRNAQEQYKVWEMVCGHKYRQRRTAQPWKAPFQCKQPPIAGCCKLRSCKYCQSRALRRHRRWQHWWRSHCQKREFQQRCKVPPKSKCCQQMTPRCLRCERRVQERYRKWKRDCQYFQGKWWRKK